jgi:hypothetical protein
VKIIDHRIVHHPPGQNENSNIELNKARRRADDVDIITGVA